MKKKILKKFIFILILIIFIDFISYTTDYLATSQRRRSMDACGIPFKYKLILDKPNIDGILNLDNKILYRPPVNINSKSNPIYIFGCSFAYGHYLKEEETFGNLLGKYTNRPIYNFSSPGWDIQHFLFLLQNLKFPEKEPEYIYYIYIHDHIRRLNAKWFSAIDPEIYITYKIQNNKPIFYTPSSLTYLYRKINSLNTFNKSFNIKFKEDNFQKLSFYIDEIQKEITKKWPKSKFILIVYDDAFNFDWSTIEQKGIQIIKIQDKINIHDKKYKRKDMHPTAYAWEILTPLIIKESKIN